MTSTTGTDWLGGPGLGPDLNGAGYGPVLASNTFSVGQTGTSAFLISDPVIATALVNDFVSSSNPGFFLKATNEGSNTYFQFYSSDNGSSAFNPRLVIDYTPVPEPAVFGMVVSGIVMGLVGSRPPRDAGSGLNGAQLVCKTNASKHLDG